MNYYVHPTGGEHIIVAFSGVRHPLSHLVSSHFKEKYCNVPVDVNNCKIPPEMKIYSYNLIKLD